MKKLLLPIFSLIFAAYPIFSAQAVGLSVSPKELKVSVEAGETAVQKLNVKNPSGEVAIFEVYPDDLEKFIKLWPTSFILEFGQSREVAVQITPKEEGLFKTNISVVASPVAKSSFNTGSGVKIPLEITVAKNTSWLLAAISKLPLNPSRVLVIALLLLIVAIGYFVVKLIRYVAKQI